jgi:hypothetical protein
MDLVACHYDRSSVLDALRQGEIDYLEHVSQAAEADFVPSPPPAASRPTPGRNLSHAAEERGSAGLDLSGQRTQPQAARRSGLSRLAAQSALLYVQIFVRRDDFFKPLCL